jgi:hypothetical protein
MADESTTATPAYIPWKTFTNTLDTLAGHMPNRIDKSAFPGQSGAVQGQLILAFRFFGLIGDDGRPTDALHAVAVKDEPARKLALRKLVENKYAALFALNLLKTTPSEFAEQMTSAYKVTGDTRLKATRFFLAATQYLGIDVSPLLQRDKTKPASNGGTTRKKRTVRAKPDEPDDDSDGPGQGTDAVESRSVTLVSGGTLTLSATTRFMSLSSADRNFVFGLIDKLEEYESATAEDE